MYSGVAMIQKKTDYSEHKRSGRGVLRAMAGVAICLATFLMTGSCVPRRPRHLVIIVSDALRRDVLGCYGGAAHTPNIDRLAREGTLFENAYSTAPTTMPSAVAMLTGC